MSLGKARRLRQRQRTSRRYDVIELPPAAVQFQAGERKTYNLSGRSNIDIRCRSYTTPNAGTMVDRRVERLAAQLDTSLTRIGECRPRGEGIAVVDESGRVARLSLAGHDHFASRRKP